MAHIPVLLDAVLEYLNPKPRTFIIDGTVNGGGHAKEILSRIAPDGTFLGVDLDPGVVHRFADLCRETESSCHLVQGNYANLASILTRGALPKADGLLLDLGFSSEQLEGSGRGFSFLKNEPLRMTYDPGAPPVHDIIRKLSESQLAGVIRNFGGERAANRIAKAIKIRLHRGPITTSGDLADVIRRATPKGYERGRIDPATRTFQALRIYANRELENLERVLRDLPHILRNDGRVVIISFHSLEDQIVKNYFREGREKGFLEILTKKPIVASSREIRENPRSRSAKLRAAKFIVRKENA